MLKKMVGCFSVLSLMCILFTTSITASTTNPGDVYNKNGNFLITEGMLDKRINELAWPGSHNSFAYGSDFLYSTERNQDLSIYDQLNNGIRVLDFDLDIFLELVHGTHARNFDAELNNIELWAERNPKQVVIVRINDYKSWSGSKSRIEGRLVNTGLNEHIYNWDSTKTKGNWVYNPSTWPTLREIFNTSPRRNVIFIHNNKHEHIVDSSACKGFHNGDYLDTKTYHHYAAKDLEAFSMTHSVWDPAHNSRQSDGANHLFHLEVTPDERAAGDDDKAQKNNDGRRLYQIAKHHDDNLLPDGRVTNVISVDFFHCGEGYSEIDVVQACNRLNWESTGLAWKDFPGVNGVPKWELYPNEFNTSIYDYGLDIRNFGEAIAIRDQYLAGQDLNSPRYDRNGKVLSTSYEDLYNFERLAEWALDNDYTTRWCASSGGTNQWGIDFGQEIPLNQISIMWEYPNRLPGYKIYGTVDGPFGSVLNSDDLKNDAGWVQLWNQPEVTAKKTSESGFTPAQSWTNHTISGNYKYIKIKVDDTDQMWGSFYEVKFYGPAVNTAVIQPSNMDLQNYTRESNIYASNGILIKKDDNFISTASFKLPDSLKALSTNSYDIKVYYFDENDGWAGNLLYINDDLQLDMYSNSYSDSPEPSNNNRKCWTIENVTINDDDTIKIEQYKYSNSADYAPIDCVQIIPR